MLKRMCYAALIAIVMIAVSGCSLVNTAVGAAIAYGIYQATR